MTGIVIIPATLRDATYIAAHMREIDWQEIACQCPDSLTPFEVAVWSLASAEACVARWHDQPIACFGASKATPAGNVLTVWAWGTHAMWRAVPAIGRWMEERGRAWVANGVTRVEARSIAGHDGAHRWMRGLGANEEALPSWGKGGEGFVLFWWNRDTWVPVKT